LLLALKDALRLPSGLAIGCWQLRNENPAYAKAMADAARIPPSLSYGGRCKKSKIKNQESLP
jgi:hypothetical protein